MARGRPPALLALLGFALAGVTAGVAGDGSSAVPSSPVLVTSLTAYFGIVGWGYTPFTLSEQRDLERALNATIVDAVAVRIRSAQQYEGWGGLPKMLKVLAVAKLSPAHLNNSSTPLETLSGSSDGSGAGDDAPSPRIEGRWRRSRRLLASGRALLNEGEGGQGQAAEVSSSVAAAPQASSEWWGPRGPPNSGVIVTADIFTTTEDPAIINLLQWELAASLQFMRTELQLTGSVAVDLLGTGLPSQSLPSFDEVPSDQQGLVDALDAGNISGSSVSLESGSAGASSSSSSGGSETASSGDPQAQVEVVYQHSFPAGLAAGIAVACVSAIGLAGLAVWQRRRLAVMLPWHAGKRQRGEGGSGGSSGLAPPSLLGDSVLDPDSVAIVKRPDGSDWLLGEGATGSVYRGLLHGKLPVAIKVLRGSNVSQEINTEIALLKACRNTHVVQFQGVVLQKDSIWLVQELCETDLFTAIGTGKVSWHKRGRRIALDVARGLHFLHSSRIVHLDLKSPNVLLTAAGTAKLCDVGLSRILTSTHVSQTTLGTFAWCAPEVLLAQRATPAADVFSFGVVLYEIITGLRPVRGQLREVRVPEECPEDVAQLMRRCLSTDPAQRPTTDQIIETLSKGMGRSASAARGLAAGDAAAAAATAARLAGGGSTASSTQMLLGGRYSSTQEVLAYACSATVSTTTSGVPGSVLGSAEPSGSPQRLQAPWDGTAGAATGQASPSLPTPDAAVAGGGTAAAGLPGSPQPATQQPREQSPPDVAESGQTFDAAYAALLAQAWQQAERASSGRLQP